MSRSMVCVRARRPELMSRLALLAWCSVVSRPTVASRKRDTGRQPTLTLSYTNNGRMMNGLGMHWGTL